MLEICHSRGRCATSKKGDKPDNINGGGGRDTIDGGKGDDKLTGNEGADIFKFTGKRFGKDVIKDFENIDEIKLTGFRGNDIKATVTIVANDQIELILRFAGVKEADASITLENLNGVDLSRLRILDNKDKAVSFDLSNFRMGDDTLTASGDTSVSLYGRRGKDTLTAADGPAHLFGGDGNDILIGGSNSDVL